MLLAHAQLNNMDNQEFTLKLNVQQVNTVLSALAELPFKLSNEVITEIASQCRQQQEALTQQQQETITAA